MYRKDVSLCSLAVDISMLSSSCLVSPRCTAFRSEYRYMSIILTCMRAAHCWFFGCSLWGRLVSYRVVSEINERARKESAGPESGIWVWWQRASRALLSHQSVRTFTVYLDIRLCDLLSTETRISSLTFGLPGIPLHALVITRIPVWSSPHYHWTVDLNTTF
jgi:hypothetical protein